MALDVEPSSPLLSVGYKLATFHGSSGILHNAWKKILGASIDNVDTFILKEYEGVVYVTFPSCTEDFIVRDSKYGECQIQNENRAFSPLLKDNYDQPACVHKGALRRFLHILENSDFQAQMQSFTNLKRKQAIVFVGHSMGGAVATLAMIWFLGKRLNLRQISPFCITFGSPLVGDVRLGEAIAREDWSNKFFHVVSKYDIVPRMLFAPFESIAQALNAILPYWGSIMRDASMTVSHPIQEACKTLLNNVLPHTSTIANNYYAEKSDLRSPYKPFGTYMFCSIYGAACIEDTEAVLKILHFTMQSKEGNSFDEHAGACISEHTDYGNMLECISDYLLNIMITRLANPISGLSFEMGIALQLEAMGIGAENDHALLALRKAGYLKKKRDMNIEKLNAESSENQSTMEQLELYRLSCNDRGYYDSFKQKNNKRDIEANMYKIKLEMFWDDIVDKVEKHELPYDFQTQIKWINAGYAYRKLVEPLDIANYYCEQKGNGSYLSQGVRPHRHTVLEKWLKEKDQTRIGRDKKPRTKFASLIQDSCFWAHLEEALKAFRNFQQEPGQHQVMNTHELKESLAKFEDYVWSMIKDKSISVEVFLEGSTFMLWWQLYTDFQLESPGWQSSSPLFDFMKNEKWKLKI